VREPSPELDDAIRKRIVVAQGLYAVGLAAGLVHVEIGMAIIILIQLNYAFAPNLPWLSKL
jgi:hypothetical protein